MLRVSVVAYSLGVCLLAFWAFRGHSVALASHLPTDSSTAVYQWVFRDYLDIKNDMGIYGTQTGTAVSNWNNQFADQDSVLRAYVTSSDIDIWLVKTGYFEDTYLAEYAFPQYLGSGNSCYAFASNPNSPAHGARAFEQGFGPTFFGQPRYGRICINYDSFSGASVYFSEYDNDPGLQTRGISHELGHAFSLAHNTAQSVMQVTSLPNGGATWNYHPQPADALQVKEYYGK